ncbi:hypothetical protein [Edaphobacter sp.]|uniref:hypothetical protein n=1 Tax=Edaphobacter sp. TaxID=1934404 RepID=UPI002DBFFC56|nr:hypothetical protein [Edaphobacter sp.]HEU5342507.1 hypothetical protein [Edaphobacter sp.]
MPEATKRPWERIFQDVGSRTEDDLRKVIQYINDEVVPDVRRNGSQALRVAAAEMQKLAQRMDDRAQDAKQPEDAGKP